MENMARFTTLYAIAYAIVNSIENLRFDKEDYFDFLVSYGLFYKRNKNIFLVFPYAIETLVKVWGELEIAWKFLLPNFYSCFYNCMETRILISIS